MSVLSLASLLVEETKEALYEKALEVAEAVGLPVTSWEAGNPTRSTYHYVSEILSELEGIVAAYVASGFLDHATGTWLKLLAKQLYGYDYEEATFATTTVTLTNTGGGLFEYDAGDLTFKNTTTGKTYHNTTGGTLSPGPGTTLDLEVTAAEAGSASTAAAGEIDDLVTVELGVTVTNATAAVGTDDESEDSIRDGCRDKLGSLSPNGPKDAYNYVAKKSTLTGTTAVTRTRTIADSDTGDVTLYLAGPSGAVIEADRALVEAAILTWAVPWTVTPTVLSATNVVVDVTYELWLYASVGVEVADIEDAIEAALVAMFRVRPIGGDVITAPPGALYRSLIESTIREVYKAYAFRVDVTDPSIEATPLTIGQVAALGTVTGSINLVEDP